MPITKNFLNQSLRAGFSTTGADYLSLRSYNGFILGSYGDIKWAELLAGSTSNQRQLTLSLQYFSVRGIYIPFGIFSQFSSASVFIYYDELDVSDYGYEEAPQNYTDWITSVIASFGAKTSFIAGDADAPNKAYRVYGEIHLADDFTLVLKEETTEGTGWSLNSECFYGLRVRDGAVRDNVNMGSLGETLRGLDGAQYNTWIAP